MDPHLITKCLEGDSRAFRPIVMEYQSYAYALALRLLCHEEDARDVVQEAFIRVWKHRNRYDSSVKFTTWLYKIVTNLCYDRLRKRRRETPVEQMPDRAGVNPESHYENRDLVARIKSLTESLSQKQRMVFVLRDLQDQSVAEVSRILKISQSAVKSNLSLARQKIRDKMALRNV